MMGIKLNAQVIITNLQNMHEKSLHFRPQERREGGCSESELEYQDWARLQGKGPHTARGGRFADRLVPVGKDFLESIIYRLRNTLNGNRPS
jgi:hypothetical protein